MTGKLLIADLGEQLFRLGQLDPSVDTPIERAGTMTSVDLAKRDQVVRAIAGGEKTVVELGAAADLDADGTLSPAEAACLIAAASIVLRAEENAATRHYKAANEAAREKYKRAIAVSHAG